MCLIQAFVWAEPFQLDVPQTEQAPVIDGILNDAAWDGAGLIDGLKPFLGGGYQDAIDRIPTRIRVTWNSEYLFVAFECRDPDIYATGSIPHDGNIYMEDVCEIFIDGMGDQRQWIEIQVNALNETLDLMSLYTGKQEYTETGRIAPKHTARDFWSFRGWEANGMITASGRLVENGAVVGWTVEMAIPATAFLKRRGLTKIEPMEIRANFIRYDHPENEDGERNLLHMNWSPVEHGCPHISPAAMGVLILK
ncbi:MAG: carbohydrate-binding family 9-like protein [Kiritimatiellae bacterium]|nr:carbohydrate-binding family 9-like protein [Kiritimatiellia bacterium]